MSRIPAWLGRWLDEFDSALAAVPDPHGQFPAVPIVWAGVRGGAPPQTTRTDGPPPAHPEHLEPR
ncbi:MAG TPA: hypothetical protein VGP26_05990 [Actinophytocola sp.]|jgi:hypothetical protein|nr:hypothetical protein [Actinophytocola sp.]